MSSGDLSSSPDVVVVGGGAIGAASAYELARRGARVTVLERSHDADGCSFGHAGLICPSHAEALANLGAIRAGIRWMMHRDSPFRLHPRLALVPWLARFAAASLPARSARATAVLRRLSMISLELYEELARAGLQIGFARRGTLSVFESARGFERAGEGAGVQRMSAGDARDLEPALARSIAGAVYHPDDAHLDPNALVGALLDAARAHGAEIRTGVELLRLRRGNGRIAALDTTAGSISTGEVVLAAGTWSRGLAREVGVHVPLEPAKGYHVDVDTALAGGIPVYMEEARVIATPLGDRLRLAGTLELAGLDLAVDPVRVATLGRAARRTLALPRAARTVHVWRGLRPCTPDGLPVIGRPSGVENLVLATGHAMLGVTLAPVTGEIVADLLAGAPARHPLKPFSPERFARRRTGRGS
jgi:D-amino-acid dehydrogenase